MGLPYAEITVSARYCVLEGWSSEPGTTPITHPACHVMGALGLVAQGKKGLFFPGSQRRQCAVFVLFVE